jgi:hypothetical protein
MDLETFRASLGASDPPGGLSELLRALWFDAKGDWEASHRIVQDLPGAEAGRIHAYLHRKEGDEANAGYWYHQAGTKRPDVSLDEEWKSLAAGLL